MIKDTMHNTTLVSGEMLNQESEVWNDIENFAIYQVSDHGRVRSIDRYRKYWKSERFVRGKVLRPASNGSGYMKVILCRGKERHTLYVHRLVAEAFHGKCPDDKDEVCHIDGNKNNNMASNLKWGTKKENQRDRYKHGTGQCGERNPRSKLTMQQVIDIKNFIKSGKMSQSELGKKYGVSDTTIGEISRGANWAWL